MGGPGEYELEVHEQLTKMRFIFQKLIALFQSNLLILQEF